LTKLTKSFVDLLLKEGLIWGYKIQKDVNNSLKICILLKYINGVPVIRKIVWVSKPSKLTYVNSQTLHKHSPFVKGLYIFIISTDLGLMTDSDARRLNLGGKVLGLII
jgi:small subunit ribosomal protein S8